MPFGFAGKVIMKSWKDMKALKGVRDELKDMDILKHKPGKIESLKKFFAYYGYSWKLMFKETELFLFIFLQWIAVALGYYLFVMMLYWIPEEVWQSTQENDEGSIADLVLFVWIFVCVGVAAFPLGIFSSCMAVVHLLHIEDKPSTIAACLKVVLPRTWGLWLFHWMDGYITVGRIIDRLPKKNDRSSPIQKALAEALYYAWKVATMGILPNLITGRSIKDTAKNTVGMIKDNAAEVIMIRIGYSVFCWIIAIATYVWGIFNYGWIKNKFFPGDLTSTISEFYFYAGIPMLFAVAIIQLFIRPAYILAISDVYGRYIHGKGETILDQDTPPASISVLVVFLVLCIAIFTAYLYRFELGIMDMLATPYGETYER
jgi:hypothetical protein